MVFKEAYNLLLRGYNIMLPHWAGYWSFEDNSIKMHTKDGDILDIRETTDVLYTMGNILSDEWTIADCDNCPLLGGQSIFSKAKAIELAERGVKVVSVDGKFWLPYRVPTDSPSITSIDRSIYLAIPEGMMFTYEKSSLSRNEKRIFDTFTNGSRY